MVLGDGARVRRSTSDLRTWPSDSRTAGLDRRTPHPRPLGPLM